MAFSLINLFSGKGGKGGNHSLADAARIAKIFQQLVSDRTMLTVKLAGVKQTYTSAALEVNSGAKTLRLDELTPADGHKLMLEKKTMQVECQTRGADLVFNARLMQAGESKGIGWYDTAFPKELDYTQRRKSFRARVKQSKRISVTSRHEDSKSSISGFVMDISNHGISIMFNTNHKIERGDRLKYCKIRLPDGKSPQFDLDVRHVKTLPNQQQLVGGSFFNTDTGTLRIIQKFVRELERDALRNS